MNQDLKVKGLSSLLSELSSDQERVAFLSVLTGLKFIDRDSGDVLSDLDKPRRNRHS